ncbi:MAG: hypothetical protein QOD93_2225 [Acetobacteraceae bacterium]|nr:hypothetical protein [Acetobacteraceae bacterium]
MASDWALEELGPRAFEQLAVALAAKVISPNIEVYGSGQDGGREATYEGKIDWPQIGDGRLGPDHPWTGYTVVQAKQRERQVSLASDLTCLKRQIRDELEDWSNGQRRRLPKNLLFVTNVRLSAKDGGGGVDRLMKFINSEMDRDRHHSGQLAATLRLRGLTDISVWHRDTLNALISSQQSIRAAFPALLTVGDILTRLAALPGKIEPEHLAPVLIGHAQSALRNEQWLRFDEAGDSPETRHPIDRIIIDLPARRDGRRTNSVLDQVFRRGDQVIRASVWCSEHPRHLVITGAPGNGKSTLSQYLTQVYRSQFAAGEANQPSITALIDRTKQSLERIDVTPPVSPRWPLRVDLAKMAAEMGPSGGPDIKRWLADRVTERGGVTIQPATLDAWIKAWPTLLVFDGLDEVTAPSLRHRIIDELTGLVESADAGDADLLMIITTRRTGYTERFMPNHFDQIDLDYLSIEEATDYGRHITQQRLNDEAPQRDLVLSRFAAAAKDQFMERLLQTPLQVLILTIILGSAGALPTSRYKLFWNYYETVYKREAGKDTTHRSFFRDNRDAITDLHQIVGLLLQVDCESTSEIHARMPRTQLQTLAHQYMLDSGHDEEAAADFATKIFTVTTQRLVLLATDEDDTVSFDVRSFQELMAGCALVDGDDDAIRTNLTATALSPHWRNSWLFAAGRLFSGSRHRRELVADIVEHCDENGHWPAWLYPAAPELAAYILEDGLAASQPNEQRRLIDAALRCLDGPVPQEPQIIAFGLRIACTLHALHTAHIRNSLKAALAASGARQTVARILAHYEQFGTARVPGSYSLHELKEAADMWRFQIPRTGNGHSTSLAELLRPAFDELSTSASSHAVELVAAALIECDQLILTRIAGGGLWPAVAAQTGDWPNVTVALRDPDASELLQVCLGGLAPEDWAGQSLLAQSAGAFAGRHPVSKLLTVNVPSV